MSGAYYNEIDPFAAAWLRNLIKAGAIAPGDVDERDIRDVNPDDLKGYRQCHFFAGIGVWSYALRSAGWADDRPVWTGSCPCQPFSAAGKRGGLADERHLWPHWHHLLRECRPAIVLGEQVASPDGLGWLDLVSADLEGEGYAFGASDLCAAGFGAPHIRQRLWFVGSHGVENPERATTERQREHGGESVRKQEAMRPAGGSVAYELVSEPCGAWVLSGQVGGVADANGGERQRLADGEERERDGAQARRQQGDGPSAAGSLLLGVADAKRIERGAVGVRGLREVCGAEGGGAAAELARSCGDSRPGPTNGFWRDADWLHCRDGKWRPVEPGTFPLAHGAAARVGRLRGFGNAIVAPVAQAFIESVMDVLESAKP